MCHFLWLQHVSIKSNDSLKKTPKKPNQKWGKYCMKPSIRHVLLQEFLFIVQFSTRCLKTTLRTFFMKNQLQTHEFVAFPKSLSGVSSTSSLSRTTWQRSLHQVFWLTLFLCPRGSLNDNFSAKQSCYSQDTLNLTKNSFLLKQAVRSV